ncbi:MAG: DegT/DnrJ/EryC1/StrS aminotransferase family protein [bacterium]
MIPNQRPVGGRAEIKALAKIIKSGWWGKGQEVEEFEKKFADYISVPYTVAVTSCSAALDLALKALNIGAVTGGSDKDEVIVPTMTFVATAMAPKINNCQTVLADIEPDSLCLDPEKLPITKNTKAVIAVHNAGVVANIKAIKEKFAGPVIEDCAHACLSKGAGQDGDLACWSFQAIKNLPAGDGGMITTYNKKLYEKIKAMIWYGVKESTYERIRKGNYAWEYDIDSLGYKYYMTDIPAAIALEQLKKLDKKNAKRRVIAARYDAELNGFIKKPVYSETVQYYIARVTNRNALVEFLTNKGIHVSVHYKPLHLHTYFQDDPTKYPVADKIWQNLITLPVHDKLSDKDVSYIIKSVKEGISELAKVSSENIMEPVMINQLKT